MFLWSQLRIEGYYVGLLLGLGMRENSGWLTRWLVIGRQDRGYERDIRFKVAKYNKKRDSLVLVSLAFCG